MAESWYKIGGRNISFSSRPLFFKAKTLDGLPYQINFSDGGSGVYNSDENAVYMYSGVDNYISITFSNPGNILNFETNSSLLVDFDTIGWVNLVSIICGGSSKVIGDVSATPIGVTNFYVTGVNELTGDVASLASHIIIDFTCDGNNTLYGLWDNLCSTIINFKCEGYNIIGGVLDNSPPNIASINIGGLNVIGGDIGNTSNTLESLNLRGNTIIGGDIATASTALKLLYVQGANVIYGNIVNAPADIYYIRVIGLNTLTYVGSRIWANNQSRHYLKRTSFTSTMIDAYLNDLSGVATWVGSKEVDLRVAGGVQRTSASDAAVTDLNSEGVLVLTN